MKTIKEWAKAHERKNKLDSRDPCYPKKLDKTWKWDVMNTSLREKRLEVVNTIANEDERGPLVIAVRQGLGNGKTHFLCEAPSMLGQEEHSVYVTYNGSQNLDADSKNPGKCILLQILFAICSFDCSFRPERRPTTTI